MKNLTNTSDFKSFHYLENEEIVYSTFSTIKSTTSLDPGIYELNIVDPFGNSRMVLKLNKDSEKVKKYNFPEKERIDKLLSSFFNEKVITAINDAGFYHKMGVLFHGKEGTGKSTIIKFFCDKLIREQEALVFYIDRVDLIDKFWTFIRDIRKIQTNPIIIVLEEIDIIFNNSGSLAPAYLKKILDGNLSISNSIFFSSTNHLDRIPETIKNRPSRFKYVINVEGVQSEESLIDILSSILGTCYDEEKLLEFSKTLKGSSIDFIKQFCLDKIMDLESYSKKRNDIGFKLTKNS